ncbi:MAG: antitoxin Xre/MbcA/ParS toxin-binding domain-containing protein [Ilumatobacteraceae bacterium]
MSNAVARRLESIQEHSGISGRDVAQLLDTTPQTISRWRTGHSSPQPRHLEELLMLEWLVNQLSAYYTSDEAKLWLFSRHTQLGGSRPADLIADRRTDEVLRLIDQLDSAAFI